MRHRNAGKVCDRLWYLGREESGVYLLEGDDCSLIISGGMSYLAPVVLEQMREFQINEAKIDKLIILHAHFDHVGLVPFFKRRYPELQIFALARGWEILKMEKAIGTINSSSLMVAKRVGVEDLLKGMDLEWRDDVSGSVVEEGSVLDLGGLTVRVLETPGHSSCSLSAYCQEIKALFPSDGGGIPFEDIIAPAGNSNFTQYQQSLAKLSSLPVDIFCADHYGYVTGEEANNYIQNSMESAREHRTKIEAIYRRTGSVEETVQEVVAAVYKERPNYFLSPEIYAGVYRQTVRHIASAMGER
ncbi:MAG: MBL fold metallo-hydrolase [Syntrophobacterales bacterium]|nr:MBL fold metallo-hydrolase [Syntrophobacterales bacterium]